MAVPEPFCFSLTQMVQYNTEYFCGAGEAVHYTHSTVSFHSFARNDLVRQMIGDWLLMLDTDHQFEPDLAMRMLSLMDKHNIDVLTGVYVFKGDPHPPVLYTYDEKTKGLQNIGNWEGEGDIMEVGSAGGGCLMIRRSVFDRIKKELKEEPFEISGKYGEDHSFFLRLKKLKIKAYFAPNIESYHLVLKPLTLKDYDKSQVKLSKLKKTDSFKSKVV